MAHRATAGGIALGIAVGWNVSNIGAVANALADAYGVALATVGLFTTALFVVHALLQLPAGRAIDTLGARRVGLASLAVLAAGNGLALAAAEPGLALAARALLGVGTALGFLSGLDYVRTQGGTPFAQGLYGGVGLGAGGLALAVVPQLLSPLGWRAPFVSAAALAAAAGAVLLASPRDAPPGAEGRPPLRGPGVTGVAELVRDVRLRRLCVVYTSSFGLAVILGNWVVTLLERAGGYSSGTAGAVGSLVLLMGVVSRPLGGSIARHRPERVRAAIVGGIAASTTGTLVLAVVGPPAVSILGALLVGFAAGIPFAAAFGAAVRARPDAPAAAVALVNMAANVTIVACTPLLGLSFSLPGDGRIGFVAMAALTATTALAVRRLPELDARAQPRAPGPAAG